MAIIGVVFATIWTRRQNWNKHDSPNSKSDTALNSDKANNHGFDPAAVQTTKISTLDFGNARRGEESDFEMSEGTQSPSAEYRQSKTKEGGSYDDTEHVKSEKENSAWFGEVPSPTITAV